MVSASAAGDDVALVFASAHDKAANVAFPGCPTTRPIASRLARLGRPYTRCLGIPLTDLLVREISHHEPAAVVNIARSQKVERAETNYAGMTVRYLLPRTGLQKSPLRPRCGLHPLDEGAATAYAAHPALAGAPRDRRPMRIYIAPDA